MRNTSKSGGIIVDGCMYGRGVSRGGEPKGGKTTTRMGEMKRDEVGELRNQPCRMLLEDIKYP